MAASTFSVPLLCCSIPRAWSNMPVAEVPHHSAACSMRAAGTPVTSAAHLGVMSATAAAASSKPLVWAAMNSWSSQPCWISPLSTAPNSAESVPGRTGRKRSAVRASGTTRGSCTISRAPRSRARQM